MAKLEPLKDDALNMALIKAVLINTQALREIRAAVMDSWTLKATNIVVTKMREQGRNYAAQCQAMGKSHGRGLHAFTFSKACSRPSWPTGRP